MGRPIMSRSPTASVLISRIFSFALVTWWNLAHSVDQVAAQSLCAAGTFGPTGSSTCSTCPTGLAAPIAGLTVCLTVGPLALFNAVNGLTFDVDRNGGASDTMQVSLFRTAGQLQYGTSSCGTYSTFVTSPVNNAYSYLLFSGGQEGRKTFLYLSCGPSISVQPYNENPTITYVISMTHPAVCGLNLTIGAEMADPLACDQLATGQLTNYCPNCWPGYSCPGLGGVTLVNPCSSGSYCPSGSSKQEQCAAGNYCPTPAQQLPCPSGFAPSCAAGTTTAPTVCLAGAFQFTSIEQLPNSTTVRVRWGPQACSLAPGQGVYIAFPFAPGSDSCGGGCGSGFAFTSQTTATLDFSSSLSTGAGLVYASLLNVAVRYIVVFGWNANGQNDYGPGSSGFVVCPPGSSYTNPPASVDPCTVCPLGTYCGFSDLVTTGRLTFQAPCPPGTYTPTVGMTACLTCNVNVSNQCSTAGYFCSAYNPLLCPPWTPSPCSPGNYCPANATSQTPCLAGNYCPTPAQQLPCPAGTT